jgi:hypothetical protein
MEEQYEYGLQIKSQMKRMEATVNLFFIIQKACQMPLQLPLMLSAVATETPFKENASNFTLAGVPIGYLPATTELTMQDPALIAATIAAVMLSPVFPLNLVAAGSVYRLVTQLNTLNMLGIIEYAATV